MNNIVSKFINKWKNFPIQTKSSIVYTLANLITKGIIFISIPLFTNLMSTSEMGVATTYSAWQAMAFPVLTISLASGSLNIAMMEYEKERDKYISSLITILTLLTATWLGVFTIFRTVFESYSKMPSVLGYIMILNCYTVAITDAFLAKQRYEYKYRSTAIVSILSSLLSTGAALFVVWAVGRRRISFTLSDDLGVVRVIVQNAVLILVGSILGIYMFIKGKCIYSKIYTKFAIKNSAPLIIHALAKSVMDVSDRTMITMICGNSDTGIYGTLYSISTIVLIVWNAINNSMIPYVFESLKKNEYKGVHRLVKQLLIAFSAVSVLMTLLLPDVIHLVLPMDYHGGVYLIPAVAGGIYFTTLYNLYSNVLLYYKKTHYIMIATSVSAVVNIGLNYIFIKNYGYMAAAYTTLLSYVLLALMQYCMMRRITKEPVYESGKLWLISGVTLACNLGCLALYENDYLRWAIIAVIVVVAVIKRRMILDMVRGMKKK